MVMVVVVVVRVGTTKSTADGRECGADGTLTDEDAEGKSDDNQWTRCAG